LPAAENASIFAVNHVDFGDGGYAMDGWYFLIPTLMAILLSMLFVRAGAIALMLTGMRYEQAKFQALSAFTATGFTTRAAEQVVNHPTRRKIIMTLMVGGYAGIATVIVSATSSFVTSLQNVPEVALSLLAGVVIIYLLGRHTGLMNRWEAFIEGLLHRRFALEFEPAEELLHLAEGYGLVRLRVGANSSLLDQSIPQIGGKRTDSLILGVERRHTWIPARKMRENLQEGDQLVIYGELDRLKAEFDALEERGT